MAHDHSGGGMDMGDGMSMSSSAGFVITNSSLARSYWYVIAGVLGSCLLLRVLGAIQTRIRLRIARSRSVEHPTKSHNFFLQSYATATAIFRETVSPELHFQNHWVSWLSPPPLGRSLLLATYWAVIIYMLCWQSVVYDAYYWERIAFRAAWTSVTQVPFVYLLASKSSIIGFLSGSSYERLNWLHRWVSRTLLVTVSIHGSFFLREWTLSGNIGNESFVAFELNLMPMVKYGIGAWFVLLWTFVSSLTPIRRLSYEIFVLQHLAAAAVFLWLIYVHVPIYAQYNVWFAVAAVSFDKTFMICWSAWENVRLRPARTDGELKSKLIGHHATLRALDDETSEVIVKDISFKWVPGQHIYLRLPLLAPLESHPFTIANAHTMTSSSVCNDVRLVVQAQTGFTKRLHRKATSAPESGSLGATAIVTGPFGRPPAWNSFETLVLISASTGASFTMAVLESIVSGQGSICNSRIDMLLIMRRRCGVENYLRQLKAAVIKAEDVGIALNVTVAITGESEAELAEFTEKINSTAPREGCQCNIAPTASIRNSSSSSGESIHQEKSSKLGFDNQDVIKTKAREVPAGTCYCGTGRDMIVYTCGRPNIEAFIRKPVEASGGETCVAVCGGRSLVAVVRNQVASLSDERAVHKGTGAQGIALHSETYCF